MRENAAAEADRAAEIVPPIVPRAAWRIRRARVVEHGLLEVELVDGTRGTIDLRPLLGSDKVIGTVFEPLRRSSDLLSGKRSLRRCGMAG